jgi:site-specific recombinase XerD
VESTARSQFVDVLAREWRAHLAALNFSPETLRAYLRDLETWLIFLRAEGVELGAAKLRHVKAWLLRLRQEELKIKTIKRRVSACRMFYQWGRGEEYFEWNPFADLPRIKGEKRLPRFLEERQVEDLISAAAVSSGRKKIHSARNVAIVEVFYGAGIRLAELHGLDLGHVSLEAGTVRVFGKGRVERLVPLPGKAVEAIRAYLPSRGELLRAKERFYEQALFVSERGGRMARDTIQEVVEKAGAKAGMDVHCHMLRHSYGTHLVERGAKLEDVQDLLGHAYIETTRGYVHTATGRLKRVVQSAHPRA